jgi:hypothetical protein
MFLPGLKSSSISLSPYTCSPIDFLLRRALFGVSLDLVGVVLLGVFLYGVVFLGEFLFGVVFSVGVILCGRVLGGIGVPDFLGRPLPRFGVVGPSESDSPFNGTVVVIIRSLRWLTGCGVLEGEVREAEDMSPSSSYSEYAFSVSEPASTVTRNF